MRAPAERRDQAVFGAKLQSHLRPRLVRVEPDLGEPLAMRGRQRPGNATQWRTPAQPQRGLVPERGIIERAGPACGCCCPDTVDQGHGVARRVAEPIAHRRRIQRARRQDMPQPRYVLLHEQPP
jgi:hypothetical protein